jgi:hypothetical protein
MYVDEIAQSAGEIASIGESEIRAYAYIAELELMKRLKNDVTVEDIRDAFIAAASLLAVSLYFSMESGVSWSAGSLSVKREGDSIADTLRLEAETMLSGYIEDEEFYFLGADG